MLNYSELSDDELIKLITTKPHNEEAAIQLLYNRYYNLFAQLCINLYDNNYWVDDCIGDLYDYLKGENSEWDRLKSFEGKSKFSRWITKVARNRFLTIKKKLIGNIKNTIYIDNNNEGNKVIQIPVVVEDNYEKRLMKVALIEAISTIKNPDQKFVILKTLQEYNSKETAELLKLKWDKDGIKRLNNKGEIIIPDAAYIDVLRQRAKKYLKEKINDIIKTN